jgi:hypothetical protein
VFIGRVARITSSKWNITKEGWKDWTKSEESFPPWSDISLPEMGIHCRTANGWSAPQFITISGGSWGLQIGVEAVDLVMIIQNENLCKSCFRVISILERTLQQRRVQLDGIPRPYGLEVGYRDPDLFPCHTARDRGPSAPLPAGSRAPSVRPAAALIRATSSKCRMSEP